MLKHHTVAYNSYISTLKVKHKQVAYELATSDFGICPTVRGRTTEKQPEALVFGKGNTDEQNGTPPQDVTLFHNQEEQNIDMCCIATNDQTHRRETGHRKLFCVEGSERSQTYKSRKGTSGDWVGIGT